MTHRGRVKNGVVVLDEPKALLEGAEVSVRALKGRSPGAQADRGRSLYERFKPFIGIAKGLPPDLARNHDHYLHGRPKR